MQPSFQPVAVFDASSNCRKKGAEWRQMECLGRHMAAGGGGSVGGESVDVVCGRRA